MTKYREILRLKSMGLSERSIAQSCNVSRKTVAKVTKRAEEIHLSWPLDFEMTDHVLEEMMFPKDEYSGVRVPSVRAQETVIPFLKKPPFR